MRSWWQAAGFAAIFAWIGAGLAAGDAQQTAFEFETPAIDGTTHDFAKWRGRPLLVVNTASFCGYTKQYGGLQKLWSTYGERGLVVIGVPSNDFSQEPKAEGDIKSFCEGGFGVTFPLTGKLTVTGEGAHPLYRWLGAKAGPPNWNFHKYLIGRDGRVMQAFSSQVTPESNDVTEWIEKALAERSPPGDAEKN
jgi:glutathione peroxidase